MIGNQKNWDPGNLHVWAELLGLVHVPLFGKSRGEDRVASQAAVLLDGPKSSFMACSTTDRDADTWRDEPLWWSWSANVRHSVLLDLPAGDVYLRRWDEPSQAWKLPMPRDGTDIQKLLSALGEARAPSENVVMHLLRAFRWIRRSLTTSGQPGEDSLQALHVFNLLLAGTEAARADAEFASPWMRCETVREALDLCGPRLQMTHSDLPLRQATLSSRVTEWTEFLSSAEPRTGSQLEPSLLLRHAAGDLYQEAHLLLEREGQLSLAGIPDDGRTRGTLPRDVRFTPVVLARFLVEQAFDAYDIERVRPDGSIEIMDPACGSGVFLLEALKELERREFPGRVVLRGFDISPISCAMADFCLNRAREDTLLKGHVDIQIKKRDSLRDEWGSPDLILMNPPFVQWPAMDRKEQLAVGAVLGDDLLKRRPDKAMAFVSEAVRCLRPGGVVGSVLPAPLLENRSGVEWREKLQEETDRFLLGRFVSYGFFRGSLVEPSFVVLRRPRGQADRNKHVRVVVAEAGSEERAIRGVRQHPDPIRPFRTEKWDVYRARQSALESASWLPRRAAEYDLLERVADLGVSRVDDRFKVRQGALTGLNEVFVLSKSQWSSLKRGEKGFFRPAITNAQIVDGIIQPGKYVFYPYDELGPMITSEQELESKVRTYYKHWLKPNRQRLEARARMREKWWLLSEERAWLRSRRPKLVTKYFGERGSFAYDESGDHIIVQGYAWIWTRALPLPLEESEPPLPFEESELPYAYLAILNSPLFESLLGCCCPRVQGGQFNLSKRFVERVHIPDLAGDSRVSGDVVRDLVDLGHGIHEGRPPTPQALGEAAARAYGVCVDQS